MRILIEDCEVGFIDMSSSLLMTWDSRRNVKSDYLVAQDTCCPLFVDTLDKAISAVPRLRRLFEGTYL